MEKCTERLQKRERLKGGREGGGRKEGGREGRKERGRKEGRKGYIVAPRRKTPNFQYRHTNARILPNKHLTKTTNTIRRHKTRTHIRTTLNTHLFIYSLTI